MKTTKAPALNGAVRSASESAIRKRAQKRGYRVIKSRGYNLPFYSDPNAVPVRFNAADGHWQVVMTLDLEHGVGHRLQLLELALELRALLQENARDRRIPRARLLDETRAEGRGLGERRVLEDTAVHHLRDQELVVVPEAGDELPLGQELVVLDGAEALEHGHHATELLPVGVAEGVEHLAPLPRRPSSASIPFHA